MACKKRYLRRRAQAAWFLAAAAGYFFLAPVATKANNIQLYSGYMSSYIFRGNLLAEDSVSASANWENADFYADASIIAPIGDAQSLYGAEYGVVVGVPVIKQSEWRVTTDIAAYVYSGGDPIAVSDNTVELTVRTQYGGERYINTAVTLDVLSGDIFTDLGGGFEYLFAPDWALSGSGLIGAGMYENNVWYFYQEAKLSMSYKFNTHASINLSIGAAHSSMDTLSDFDALSPQKERLWMTTGINFDF